jgi:hypothetical protein
MTVVTDRSIVAENLTKFTEQLATEFDSTKRASLINLLIEEVNKLGLGLEQLDIIDARIASGHRLIARQRALVADLAQDGHDTQLARSVLGSLTHSQTLFEAYKRQIVDMLDSNVL